MKKASKTNRYILATLCGVSVFTTIYKSLALPTLETDLQSSSSSRNVVNAILDELKPLNVISYEAHHNPNPPLSKDQQLPLTLLVHHRELFVGCHSFERFFSPKWHTIIVVEADMAEQYKLQELAREKAKTSPAIHLAFVDQTKTMTGEWLGRSVALKIMSTVYGSSQRTPLILSTQCDIHPLPEFHALHRSYEDVVSRMVHLFLEEDRMNQQEYRTTNVNEYKHLWNSAPLDKEKCSSVFNDKGRPLLTMNVAMLESLPNTENFKGSKFHSLQAGLVGLWEDINSKPHHIPSNQPWMSDISTWVEDHFNLYNVTLLEEIIGPFADVGPTISAGVKAIPNILCQKKWKAVRLNDEPVFYDVQKQQLQSRGKNDKFFSLFEPSKYKSTPISMDWLLKTSVINLAKINSPLGCQREYQRLRIFTGVDVISACIIAKQHFQSNHLPSHFWNSTIRNEEPLVVAIMSLYGYELYEKSSEVLTFVSMPLFHSMPKNQMKSQLDIGHLDHSWGEIELSQKEKRDVIKINRNNVLKEEMFFDELKFSFNFYKRGSVQERQSQDARTVCSLVGTKYASLPDVKALSDSCVPLFSERKQLLARES